MYYIYALIDPRCKKPFYIGKGKGNRAFDHLKIHGGDKANKKKVELINEIRMSGTEPEVRFICEGIECENKAYIMEHIMIKNAHKYGIQLTNRIGVDLRPPSRKGAIISDETKKKIGESSRNRKRNPFSSEVREKMSKAALGKQKPPRTDEHKKNIGISKAKLFDVIFPDGHIERIFNMRQFCKENGLSQGHLHSTTTGKRNHHKGFKARKYENSILLNKGSKEKF